MPLLDQELAAEQALSSQLEAYAGRWVAVCDHKVVASADSYEELLEQIDETEVEGVFEVIEDREQAVCFF